MTADGNSYHPSCAVVICTHDRPEELDRCLAAVFRLDYPKFDVLVVDSAPSNDMSHQVAVRWNAEYHVCPVAGVNRARNIGARAARGEIIGYLDDDAVPEPGWLEALSLEFEDPKVLAVAGRVLPPDSAVTTQGVCSRVAATDRGTQRMRLDSQNPAWLQMAAFGAVGDGCNMAIRRKAFEVWPGFDERLCRGASICGSGENHAFATLIEAGYAVLYTPQAVVRHRNLLTMQQAKADEFRGIRSGAAYATLLFVERLIGGKFCDTLSWARSAGVGAGGAPASP